MKEVVKVKHVNFYLQSFVLICKLKKKIEMHLNLKKYLLYF